MQITCEDTTGKPRSLTMCKPFDGHQHLRQGAMLKLVAPMVAKRFAAAIIMPNTTPPITRETQLPVYWQQIRDCAPEFTPLLTMYLTDTLNPAEAARCFANRTAFGVKYYPRGLTTNSDSGVENPESLWTQGTKPYEVLRALAQHKAVLLIHAADGFASMTWGHEGRSYCMGDELDPYDQEPHFILNTLSKIREAHPDLKISVEHLSTKYGVQYLRKHGGENLGCSLTAQHLLLDRRDSFRGGFRPHRSWWPIIQPKEHRDELRRFAAEGHSFVWLGSDSAPHPLGKKITDCCTGGVLMAHAGIELYAEAFEAMNCLNKLEDFASFNGPKFYGIERSTEVITLVRKEWRVEQPFYCLDSPDQSWQPSNENLVVPFRLGETVQWKLAA